VKLNRGNDLAHRLKQFDLGSHIGAIVGAGLPCHFSVALRSLLSFHLPPNGKDNFGIDTGPEMGSTLS
jgi:hypothetical protein